MIQVIGAARSCEEPGVGGLGSLDGAKALVFVDLADGNDFELFWGDFFARSLYSFNNTGSANDPEFELISEAFPLD